jgi:2-(1,2-epoxy-1,2-dihydrophenyl)acetyl-CoA isomerase
VVADEVRVDQRDGVLTLTLNRPEVLNALTDAMLGDLHDALRRASRDGAVRCVVLTGAGRGFCAGQDLQEAAAADAGFLRQALRTRFNPIVLLMRTMDKPVLAAVNGVAAGAGCSLALAADLRLASDRATFIQAFSRVGLIPDSGATYLLPRLVGVGRALELIYTADPLSAEDAWRLGLVNRVVPHDDLIPQTQALAARLAAGPTRAFGLAKRAVAYGLSATFEQALEYEAMLQEVAGRTDDYREGVAAFLEKRPPRFAGR